MGPGNRWRYTEPSETRLSHWRRPKSILVDFSDSHVPSSMSDLKVIGRLRCLPPDDSPHNSQTALFAHTRRYVKGAPCWRILLTWLGSKCLESSGLLNHRLRGWCFLQSTLDPKAPRSLCYLGPQARMTIPIRFHCPYGPGSRWVSVADWSTHEY